MAVAPLAAGVAGGGDAAEETAPTQSWPAPRIAWYALILFVLGTMMNFLDVGVFQLMIEMIKRDFQLTDVQVGLLLGPAAVLFYPFIGIPLARLVDTRPRNIILAAGLAITSTMTALGGVVQGYAQLFSTRMVVGTGGSVNGPGVYSMLADYFPPHKLHRAIAVLQAGFILGTGLASVLGGLMLAAVAGWQPTQLGPFVIRNWQWVLIAVGLPGFVIALLILIQGEPPRRGKIGGSRQLSFTDVFREIGRRRTVYLPLFIGLAVISVQGQGLLSWQAPFMMRTYGWTPAQVGAWGGVISLIAAPIGIVLGTWLTEYLGRRHKDAAVRVTALSFASAVPFSVASPLMPTGELAMVCAALSAVLAGASAVPQNTAIQRITPNEMRGQVTAIYLFMFTVFGALGSLFIAAITRYVVGDEQKLWMSMAISAAVLMPIAAYAIVRGIRPYGREIERMEAEESGR